MQTYGEALYHIKRRFLIIGLTGYTGAGCTTVPLDILSKIDISLVFYMFTCKINFQLGELS